MSLFLAASVESSPEISPCGESPPGMTCIQGGPAVIGNDDDALAKPRHETHVSTFYLDTHEVTNAAYVACIKAGACPKRTGMPSSYDAFLGPEQPAVPISHEMAHAYCVWAGKRLPTEAEWEKAARGGAEARLYPWGNEAASCDKAAYKGCQPALTRKVGSFAAGPYGVHDLAGNGFEWVNDWASPSYDGCGEHCLGKDPQGPCGGAPTCPGHDKRVLKGGSWYWPPENMVSSVRRAEKPRSGLHRLSFRCASSTPVLTTSPPEIVAHPLPALADPEPPTAAELKAFNDVVQDDDILKLEECERNGKARLDCRDPMSYIKSNERYHAAYKPYIQNLGGGYVGLGADQNYKLIASARSRWAWIFDYDPAVVRVHVLIRILVLANPTPGEFVKAFALENKQATRQLVSEALASDQAERDAVLELLAVTRGQLEKHYTASFYGSAQTRDFGWLSSADNYRYVRLMFQQGRVQVIRGNMLTDKALPSVARSARALSVPIRVYYASNAEEQWRLPKQYMDNVLGLPFDERSVALRTLISKRFHHEDSYWHYVVHDGLALQRTLRLGRYERVRDLMEDRLPTGIPYLSTIRLPGVVGGGEQASLR